MNEPISTDKLVQRIGLTLTILFTLIVVIANNLSHLSEIAFLSIITFIAGSIFIEGTLFNIYRLIQECLNIKVGTRIRITLGCYITLMIFIYLFCTLNYFGPDYQTPLVEIEPPYFHEPVSTQYGAWFYIMMGTGIFSVIIIRIARNALPPLVTVILFSLIFLQMGCWIVYIIQLLKNIDDMAVAIGIFCIINFLIYEIRIIIRTIHSFPVEKYSSIIYSIPNRLLYNSRNWGWMSLILMLPLLCICMLLLCLFGQQPDSFVKAFTETSDWLLSEQVSPPALPHTGHYLCTVSVQGHKKLVKPLRWGIRGGTSIWVNRQLLIANAFEQIAEERIPSIHRIIRRLYDRYGYPIAKHITTPVRADIVYILMKPLEYCFLIVIYLFDTHPEDRIARQYLPGCKKIGINPPQHLSV